MDNKKNAHTNNVSSGIHSRSPPNISKKIYLQKLNGTSTSQFNFFLTKKVLFMLACGLWVYHSIILKKWMKEFFL